MVLARSITSVTWKWWNSNIPPVTNFLLLKPNSRVSLHLSNIYFHIVCCFVSSIALDYSLADYPVYLLWTMAQPAPHYEYRLGTERRVGTARAAFWVRVDTLSEAIRSIENQNLDTVEGSRDAIAVAHGVHMVRGSVLFGMGADGPRFPGTWDDFYLTTLDEEFSRVWNGLLRALEARDTSIPKDTQVGRQQAAPATGVTAEKTSQSLQDNRKAIAELLNKLSSMCGSEIAVWDRRKTERELGLTWG